MPGHRPIRIALHASLTPWAPEVKYVLRTLMRVAGYPIEFRWVREAAQADAARTDLYYGPQHDKSKAPVSIVSAGRHFTGAPWLDPQGLAEADGVPWLEFSEKETPNGFRRIEGPRLWFANDIVFGCYWLLTGAPEPRYRRDRWDNLDVTGSFFRKHDLGSKPLVSLYAKLLREHFESLGIASTPRPWAAPGRVAAAISHDVDYPEMIRWIECLRLLARRGVKGIKS